MIDLVPLGDRGFLATFAGHDDAARWARTLSALAWPGVVDVVPAYRTVGVAADPEAVDLDALAARLHGLSADPAATGSAGRLIRIPVVYDGPDMTEVSDRLGRTPGEVVGLHAGRDYRVNAVGFLPGFPYAGDLPEGLAGLARRAEPRTRVPAGSVAIVGTQTAIYPAESPGGWHLIGRTPLRIVDVARGHFPIRAGDRLRFDPIDADRFDSQRGDLA